MSNYHLLIVHFPIVFATMYGLVEVISFFMDRKNKGISTPRTLFLAQTAGWIALFGTASILVARETGEIIRDSAAWSPTQQNLIEMHSFFSGVLLVIFIIALLGYAIDFIFAHGRSINLSARAGTIFTFAQKILSASWLRLLLGLSSVIVVSAVGALGGAVAFGCDIDPLARFMCTFFQ